MTQLQLATAAGLSRRRLVGYEAGETKPRLDTLYALAKVLGVEPDWLTSGEGYSPFQEVDDPEYLVARFVPILPWLDAGKSDVGRATGDDPTHFWPVPMAVSPRAFAVIMNGEAMIDDYQPGDIVVVDPDVTPINGDDVLVTGIIGLHEPSLRRLVVGYGEGNHYKALNPQYPNRYISDEDYHISVIGVAVLSIKARHEIIDKSLGFIE